jgi:hypothetical protein
MLNLQKILAVTPKAIKLRARDECYSKAFVPKAVQEIAATRSGSYLVDDPSGKYREFRRRVRCTDGIRRTVARFYGPINLNTRVWVSCSCPFFLYHCEVALTKHGSSSIIYSNGQLPKHTNPRMIPLVCKHVIHAVALAMKGRLPGKKIAALAKNAPARVPHTQTKRAVWHGDQTASEREPTYSVDKESR